MAKLWWRLPVFILLWIPFLILKGITYALGLAVVAFMWKYRETDRDELPKRFTPWLNPEDWKGGPNHYAQSLPKWWIDKKGIAFKSWYRYHAIRNGANGLRNYEWLDLDLVSHKVEYVSPKYYRHYEPSVLRKDNDHEPGDEWGTTIMTAWYIAWQGIQAGFKIVHIWPDLQNDIRYWFFGKRVIAAGPRHLVIKVGWRIQPSDVLDEEERDPLFEEDIGFANKVLLYRKG